MNYKTKSALKKNIHYIIFSAFILLQGIVIFFVPLFGDDFYYGSFIKKGFSFFVTENFIHYTQTNGRAFVHLLDQILLIGGTTFLWKVFNLITLGFAIFFTAATCTLNESKETQANKKLFTYTLIAVTCLCAMLEISILRQSIYWATGSMNYLFPYALFITYYYLLRINARSENFPSYLWILAFFTGFSAEQVAFASLVATVFLILKEIYQNRTSPHSQYYNNLIACGAGFALQIFAPGNFVRQTHFTEFYSNSIIKRLSINIKPLYNIIFNADGIYIFILLLFTYSAFHLFSRAKALFGEKKIVKSIILTLISTVICFTIFRYIYALLFNRFILTELIFLLLLSFSLLAFLIISVINLINSHDFESLFFLFLAAAMQVIMLLSPQYGYRTLLISAFCIFVPLVRNIHKYLKKPSFAFALFSILVFSLWNKNYIIIFISLTVIAMIFPLFLHKKIPLTKSWSRIILSLIICLSLFKVSMNAYGYYQNYPAHQYNRAVVREYKSMQEKKKTLIIAKLPNPNYKYTMPYDDPYHLHWYKIINDLPDETIILFEEYDKLISDIQKTKGSE